MPVWLTRVAGLLFTRKKILGYIAAVALTVIYLVFGVTPAEVKEAVKDAQAIEIPIAAPEASPANGSK